MTRQKNRVNFRLSDTQFVRWQVMIGNLYGVHNWTDLCRKALHELHERNFGESHPLGTVPTSEKPQSTLERFQAQLDKPPLKCPPGAHVAPGGSEQSKPNAKYNSELSGVRKVKHRVDKGKAGR
jgi:hypothetical protein